MMLKRIAFSLIIAVALISVSATGIDTSARSGLLNQKPRIATYYPPKGEWQQRRPEEVGMVSALLDQAVAYARTQGGTFPRDFSTQVEIFGALLGPLPKEHAETNGIIIRRGYVVAEWGDTKAIDPTYSVAKSFLSTLFGLAVDRGLISSVHDPVKKYVTDGGYDSPHNAKITWEQHLQQTSEWEGSMRGKSHDFLGVKEFGKGKREPRPLHEPGAYWEYNDVRINRFALSLLEVYKKPLPKALKQEVMDRVGASDSWQYQGYYNSDVTINGKKMKSVSGGTRWGGGLWISTRDEARFGYLFLRRGKWKDKQIISDEWVRMATRPVPIRSDYGYLWWLNAGHKLSASAPETSFAALGNGSNTIWIDPENDLVIVWRWHEDKSRDEFLKRVLSSIKTD